MAMVDYGVMIKKNGIFVNKNMDIFEMFEENPYIPETAVYKNNIVRIDGNYFAYIGDNDLMLCFYKNYITIISNGQILDEFYLNDDIQGESHIYNDVEINLNRLDKTYKYIMNENYGQTWADYVKDIYIEATGNEKLYELDNGKRNYKKFLRIKKRICRDKGIIYKYLVNQFICTFTYKGDKYEVIFGSMIDAREKVYNQIKNGYTPTVINIIDKWFY